MHTYDFFTLCSAWRFRTPIIINGFLGRIRSMEQESGCGTTYNVTMIALETNEIKTLFVRIHT